MSVLLTPDRTRAQRLVALKRANEVRSMRAGVKQDLLFILARCGFDSFELAPGQKIGEALAALDRYSVAYQPAEPLPSIREQRYFTAAR